MSEGTICGLTELGTPIVFAGGAAAAFWANENPGAQNTHTAATIMDVARLTLMRFFFFSARDASAELTLLDDVVEFRRRWGNCFPLVIVTRADVQPVSSRCC
jgi:hypothetical protein